MIDGFASRWSSRARTILRWSGRRALVVAVTVAGLYSAALAADRPMTAGEGVELTAEAARAWSPDAHLIYLENDEALDAAGAATRWGYLYRSPSRNQTRSYSVRNGEIVQAANPAFKFEAPPVAAGWMDSAGALASIDHKEVRCFVAENGGSLTNMILMRAVFDSGTPDRTCWLLRYTSETVPSLFVVLDAATGKVVRTWRG